MWFQVRVVNGLGDIGCHLMVGARPIMIMPPIDVVGCIRLGAVGVRNDGGISCAGGVWGTGAACVSVGSALDTRRERQTR